MADASMYDAMGDFGDGEGPTEEMGAEETEEESAEDIDGEFAMHAEKLGFTTPEQQKALKSAIERCVALKGEGEYEEPAVDDEMAMGEDLEAPL